MRLRRGLFVLAAAPVVPVLAFALLAAGLLVQQQNDNLLNVAKTRNRATLTAVDAELRGVASTLHAISDVHELRSDDVRAFHGYAQGLLQVHTSWQNVLLHDADGRQIANARLPWGAELLKDPVEARTLDAARLGQRVAISDLIAVPSLGNELGISVCVPVMRESRVVYVLTAVLRPRAFQVLLEDQELPAQWITGLVDSQGRLIARVPTRAPGSPAAEVYLRHAREADEGWFRGRSLEGHDMYTAFLKSPLTGWSIGFAIPAQAVAAGPLRTAWLMGGGIALAMLAATMIVLRLSRRIAGPMHELAHAAALLGSGSAAPTVASDIDEVRDVSESLTKAAADIATRDRKLRSSEAELRQRAAELLQANMNKRRFLAMLGHELRNPLAPLSNGLVILKRSSDEALRVKVQTMMERQVAQLTRLIDDLLDVHRIDRGQLELRRELLSIEAVVASAVDTVKPTLDAKRQVLEVHGSEAPLHVDADFVRLSQVVSNLLNNASKYSPPGARITVDISADRDTLALAVEDTGAGFESGDATRIFDVFVRLDAGGTRHVGGLGVGLTIAKSIVELHGGSIEAASDGPGRGARFTVRLPLASSPKPRADADRSPVVPGSGRRVLVVDDNVDAANSLAEVLLGPSSHKWRFST